MRSKRRERKSSSSAARSRMSAEKCVKVLVEDLRRSRFQSVSPAAPKNSRRMLLSTPTTAWPWRSKCATASEPMSPLLPVTRTDFDMKESSHEVGAVHECPLAACTRVNRRRRKKAILWVNPQLLRATQSQRKWMISFPLFFRSFKSAILVDRGCQGYGWLGLMRRGANKNCKPLGLWLPPGG